jgi:hypothetical protein
VSIRIYLEAGAKKVFAGAVDWPGWSRGARTRDETLAALLRYGPRYKSSVGPPAASLTPPAQVSDLVVVASLRGGSGTDFGVPSTVADFDRTVPDEAELERQLGILRGAWQAVDRIALRAKGKTLATGPRGGGRSLDKIVDHVAEADRAYIGALGAKAPPSSAGWHASQRAFIEAIHAKLRGELPERGPRGGERWPALYAIRRSAWHALDHAWEIQDRLG